MRSAQLHRCQHPNSQNQPRHGERHERDPEHAHPGNPALVAVELAHHDEMQSERALWDVRNKAGRGPMSEAQMTDREEVVPMLLSHLCDNARPSPQSTDDLTTRTDNLHVSEA